MKPYRTTRVAVVGLGSRGRTITEELLVKSADTKILAACDPSFDGYAKFAEILLAAGLDVPPYERDLRTLLHKYYGELDAAIICSPPASHYEQSILCLEAGLDVLVEKQMTTTVTQAIELVETCKRTGRVLSVAFQGSYAREIQEARQILDSGKLGQIQTVQAAVWQNWFSMHFNEWRMNPETSGSGFLFDTGSHAISSVLQLVGEDFASIGAEFDCKGTTVEVNASFRGRLRSQALVQILATGDTAESCGSDIRVYCADGILRTTAWGDSLEILRKQPKNWKLTGSSREEGWEPVKVRKTGECGRSSYWSPRV